MKHLNFLLFFFALATCFAGNESTTEENTTLAATERTKSEIVLSASPNPFNKATSIEFQVPQESQVKLTVFGSSGQEIKNLYDGSATANTEYKVDFNAAELMPGMYFYKLESGNGQVQVNKLLLAKN
jgi:hypothetical protein